MFFMLVPHSYISPASPARWINAQTIERLDNYVREMPTRYARALGVPVLLANKCGPWEPPQAWAAALRNVHSPGLSAIADSDGTLKAELGGGEGVIVADVTLDPSRKRSALPHAGGRWMCQPPPGQAMIRLAEAVGALGYSLSPARKRKARKMSRVTT